MEATFSGLCSRLSLPPSLVESGLSYQRLLSAKQSSGLGASSTMQATICLHLAATQAGHGGTDIKTYVGVAGAKSKPAYLSLLATVEKILGLDQVLSVSEVAVQLGVSSVSKAAAKALTTFEEHLKKTHGEAGFSAMNTWKSIYVCAAVLAAAKLSGEKVDIGKAVDLSRSSKNSLVELSEKVLASQPEKELRKGGLVNASKQQSIMDRIMGTEDDMDKDADEEGGEGEARLLARDRLKEADWEDDGFHEWRQDILRRAVEQGATKYKKYLVSSG